MTQLTFGRFRPVHLLRDEPLVEDVHHLAPEVQVQQRQRPRRHFTQLDQFTPDCHLRVENMQPHYLALVLPLFDTCGKQRNQQASKDKGCDCTGSGEESLHASREHLVGTFLADFLP